MAETYFNLTTKEVPASVANNDGIEVGDVFVSSWGYDQTNVNAYEVVRTTKATVWLVPIQTIRTETHTTSERVRPVYGSHCRHWRDKEAPEGHTAVLKRKPRVYGGRDPHISITINEGVEYASKWDGERDFHQTAYGFGH